MLKAAKTLDSLIIYRQLLEDSLVQNIIAVMDGGSPELKAQLAYQLIKQAEELGLSGNIAQNYLIHLIMQDDNIFSQQAEKNAGVIGKSLYAAAVQDISVLRQFIPALENVFDCELLSAFTPTAAAAAPGYPELADAFLDSGITPEALTGRLIQHYVRFGYGPLARHTAFRWVTGQGLVGVTNFEAITFADIIGYEKQKSMLLANTQAFMEKKPCNNVLLVGARGTGKSSSVKALANRFYRDGLRLVEVSKHDQKDLYNVLKMLNGLGKRFIVYLDDLSFEENESEYKYLKSILEGGVEGRPENVLIYATSNRHHLIRETWNDRGSNHEDLHRFDTVNEKLSLSDRFGLTVTFLAPDQEQYMSIVEALAKKHHLNLSSSELRAQALKWEMTHSGRSGRVARQFIDHLLGSVV